MKCAFWINWTCFQVLLFIYFVVVISHLLASGHSDAPCLVNIWVLVSEMCPCFLTLDSFWLLFTRIWGRWRMLYLFLKINYGHSFWLFIISIWENIWCSLPIQKKTYGCFFYILSFFVYVKLKFYSGWRGWFSHHHDTWAQLASWLVLEGKDREECLISDT